MAQLIYKPRPKMPSWSPPIEPKPKRSYFYWWAVVVWLSVIAVGYHFLPIDWGRRPQDASIVESAPPMNPGDAATPTERTPPASSPLQGETSAERSGSDRVAHESQSDAPSNGAKQASLEIVSCEEFSKEKSIAPESRLPMHLGRSALDAFIGENEWARPCRGKHHQTVQLCVAILDGAVRGLTLKSARPNLTLENCLREQAKKLVLAPDSSLRIVNTTFRL